MRIKNIIPSWLQEDFYKERLAQVKQNAWIEEDVLSFDVFKRQNMPEDMNKTKQFLEASKIIRANKEKLKSYYEMVKYPSFIEEILSFYEKICEADLPIQKLNRKNELTEILNWLEENFHQYESEHNFIEKIETGSFDSFVVMKTGTSIFDEKILEKMIENGAKELKNHTIVPNRILFKKALNPRQECEAVIQDLLKREIHLKDVLVVLADYENELPVLRQVAKRYGIPLNIGNVKEQSEVVHVFSSGIELWLKRDTESLIDAIRKGFFDLENSWELEKYIELFTGNETDFLKEFNHVETCLKEDHLLNKRDQEKLLNLEKNAEEKRKEMVGLYQDLMAIEHELDLLSFLFEYCKNKKIMNDPAEVNVLLQIKEDIEACYKLMECKEALIDFKYQVEKKRKTTQVSVEGLAVTSIARSTHAKKLVYVLSLQQENYPGFSPLVGLFDESYVENTKYPSLKDRLDFHNECVSWIQTSAEELVLSFCCSSYDGKAKEASYEIEEFVKTKPVFWDLIQNEEKRNYRENKISEETAEKLFVKEDGKIHGSISSFERYFLCPYSYFLQSGLRLYDDDLIAMDGAMIGSIQHAVLEELIQKYGKKYTEISSDLIADLVKKQFDSLKKLYFNQKEQIECTQQRMIESLCVSLEFLKEMEENTSFVCAEQEYQFEMDLLSEDEVPIHLRGIIDRIDRCQDALRILDYKSSDKNLSKNKVLAGVQLQLLTYLIIATKIFNAKAMGAYYFSLKNSTVKVKAGKLNGRNFEYSQIEEEDLRRDWIKEEELKGWTFDDSNVLDYNGQHINNLSVKDGKVSIRGGKFDFKQVEKAIYELYRILKENLLQGKIECSPKEGACLFCDYKPICTYRGSEKKIESLIEAELQILEKE